MAELGLTVIGLSVEKLPVPLFQVIEVIEGAAFPVKVKRGLLEAVLSAVALASIAAGVKLSA